jgi:hypothetical protein
VSVSYSAISTGLDFPPSEDSRRSRCTDYGCMFTTFVSVARALQFLTSPTRNLVAWHTSPSIRKRDGRQPATGNRHTDDRSFVVRFRSPGKRCRLQASPHELIGAARPRDDCDRLWGPTIVAPEPSTQGCLLRSSLPRSSQLDRSRQGKKVDS